MKSSKLKTILKEGVIEITENDLALKHNPEKVRANWNPTETTKVSFKIVRKELGDFYVKMAAYNVLMEDFLSECVDAFLRDDPYILDVIMKKVKVRNKLHDRAHGLYKRMVEREEKDYNIFKVEEKDLPEL